MAKEILHMKIDSDLKQKLKRLAEIEHRNLSNLVEKVLIEYAEKRNPYPSKSFTE